MSQKIAVDVGHGYTKGLSETGERVLFPSLIAPATADMNLGPLASSHSITVQWGSQPPRSYWVGDEARLQAISLFGSDKASDLLTRDLTVIAASRLIHTQDALPPLVLAVGVPLTWYGRERQALQQALLGTVSIEGQSFDIATVQVFPQGVAAILSALPRNASPGLYGLIDIGYRTTDYLVVQVNESGLPTLVPGLAGSWEQGIHNALQTVSAHIEQQWRVSYAPHELAQAHTITVRGHDIMVSPEIRQALTQLGSGLTAKLQTVWAPILPRLKTLYLVGGGVDAMSQHVGSMPTHVVPDGQWANAQGYLSALGPSVS
jgi:plasmid segregation protein ParM